MPRPRTHDAALRGRLLDRAGELLSEQGPRSLTLRALAADVGTSTSAVYSLFDGKSGLLGALYREAFRRFAEHLDAVPETEDPVEDLVALGLAYRDNARANPHLYAVMFGAPIPDLQPDERARAIAQSTFDTLQRAAERGVEAGVFSGSARSLALAAWGIAHGLVSLELAGALPTQLATTDHYETALRTVVKGWSRAVDADLGSARRRRDGEGAPGEPDRRYAAGGAGEGVGGPGSSAVRHQRSRA